MKQRRRYWDLWTLPTLLLWCVFFLLAVEPRFTFWLIRDAANVLTQRAVVNSAWALSIAFAGYFTFFAYRACRNAGLYAYHAETRAVQCGILALVGFQPNGFESLLGPMTPTPTRVETVRQLSLWLLDVASAAHPLLLLTYLAKLLAWAYLFSLIWRYYALGNRRVFATMTCVFPSGAPPREDADDNA
jgi:hypothetical protein